MTETGLTYNLLSIFHVNDCFSLSSKTVDFDDFSLISCYILKGLAQAKIIKKIGDFILASQYHHMM